ncbi:MAG: CotH kinase family protein [Treponema sp.]|nr:CotH kinase family protein [Treponema sp.]
MRIRRHSPASIAMLALVLASSAFFAFAGFYSGVREEDYRNLDLPILNVHTYGRQVSSTENFLDAVYTLDDGDSHWEGGCKIKGRGNSTWRTIDTSKKPYLLKLDEEAGLLGMGSARRWVLKASATDKSFLRDEYAFHLAHEVWNRFAWTPRQKFVNMVLNGKYIGLYGIQEKIEIAPGRVDIDPAQGSILLKIDEHRNTRYSFTSNQGVIFNIVEADGMEYSWDEFLKIEDLVNDREEYLYGEKGRPGDWTRYFDLDSLVDWYLVNEFTKNHDSRFQGSCFIHYDGPGDKFYMGPVWDFDLSSGNTDASGCSEADGYITDQAFWYDQLLQDDIFVDALKGRWKEKREELDRSIDLIQGWADGLADAAILNDRVWKSFGHRQWPNPRGWRNRKTYQSEIDYMTEYLRARLAWLDSQWGGD